MKRLFISFSLLLLTILPAVAQEPYAVLSDDNTVLTFYYDENKESRGGMSVGPFMDENSQWEGHAKDIITAVFDDSFANCTSITNTSYWFANCEELTTISGIENLKTNNVIFMYRMFYRCRKLTSVDVSHFETQNVTYMRDMFCLCSSLTSIDLNNFNTSNVSDMFGMFNGCGKLTSLDLGNFDTKNVTDMGRMFEYCSMLTNLNVSHFDTGNVTDMVLMFSDCNSLTSLDVSNFDTKNVTYMDCMFRGCSALTTIYCNDTWNSQISSERMFEGCASLPGYSADNVNDASFAKPITDGGYFTPKNGGGDATPEPYAVLSDDNTVLTFYYDENKESRGGMSVGPFKSSDEERWGGHIEDITTVVFDASFANCTTLTSTKLWFIGCKNLTTISGIEHLNTENVTSMGKMFTHCSSLTNLDVSHFNTSNVTNMGSMFDGCRSLMSLDVRNFDTRNVTNMAGMFFYCSSLTSLDVSHFDTSNVTSTTNMFGCCSNLTTLYCDDTWTAKFSGDMFTGCASLPGYSTDNVNDASFAKPIADGGYFTPISEKIKPIGEETTINPSDEAVPGKTVITKDGLVISLGENDTVDKENGSVTVTTIMSPDELKELLKQTKPNEPKFYGQFKSMYSMLAAGSGIMEITFQTLGDYDFIVMQGTDKVARYKQDEKGTIRVKYDSNENEWVFFFPTVSAAARAKMGREAIEGGLVIYSIKFIPDDITPGDANNDGTVNAADIVEVVSYIMGAPSGGFNETAADANGDGTVNAADIVAIVNIIMGN